MKNLLIFAIFGIVSCTPSPVDCDHVKSTCTFVLHGYTDCTPDDERWDSIQTDTITTTIVGCPDKIESDFEQQQIQFQTSGTEQSRRFSVEYPSTCNCQ